MLMLSIKTIILVFAENGWVVETYDGSFSLFRKLVSPEEFFAISRDVLNFADYKRPNDALKVHIVLVKKRGTGKRIGFLVIRMFAPRIWFPYQSQKILLDDKGDIHYDDQMKDWKSRQRELMFVATSEPNRMGALLQYYAVAWIHEQIGDHIHLWMQITEHTFEEHGKNEYIRKLQRRYAGSSLFRFVSPIYATTTKLFAFGSFHQVQDSFASFLHQYFPYASELKQPQMHVTKKQKPFLDGKTYSGNFQEVRSQVARLNCIPSSYSVPRC
jgi:hypothetical protein